VQRRFCEDGLRLDTTYFEKTRLWITAEADKRAAVAASRQLDPDEWNRIARRADDAKGGHEEALREYMEHVVLCPVCHAHVAVPEHLMQSAR
jgi:hypothetical protein